MPELPEVEVTRRQLAPAVLGRAIARVHTTAPSYFFITPPEELSRVLVGRTPTALTRHGKYLLAEFPDGARLLLHLGMTGQLFMAGASSLRLLSSTSRASLVPESQRSFRPDQHTHLRLAFEDGGPELYFRDVRKFGKVLFLPPGATDKRLEKLGPDALAADAAHLYTQSRGRRVAAKSFLLDQAVLAGVGNIYADEALFLAGVRPTRPAGRLGRRTCAALIAALQKVMRRSIETGGSSISDYVAPDGSDGGYQDERQVYARAGEPCRRCPGTIERRVIGGRGSHYCPRCQRR